MPVEPAIEQTEVASINIDERSLALQGGQVERQALDLGDPAPRCCAALSARNWTGGLALALVGSSASCITMSRCRLSSSSLAERAALVIAEAMKAPPERR